MIRHIVSVRFSGDASTSDIDEIRSGLAELKETLNGIAGFGFGANVSPETEVTQGYTHAFWFDFDDEFARDAYLNDDDHKAIGARLLQLTQGGRAGIAVVDIIT